jgi:quinol monooxygenase YgiN
VGTPTDTDRDLLTVVATMRAKPGKEQELREALEAMIPETLKESGNVSYDLHQGVEDPAVLILYENRRGADDQQGHLKTPHVQAAVGRMGELVDGELSIVPLRRIA